jgi:hypothetical protein
MPETADSLNAVDVATASRLTGIPGRTIRWKCKNGRWPAKKLAGSWIIPQGVVEQHTNEESPDREDPAGAEVC